jgi:hypothetical protein
MRTINIVRGSENDIIIPDGAVKRNHASLIIDGNEFIIRDLDSVNDTFINGKRVYGQARLNRHDILKVGGALVPWMNYICEFNRASQATVDLNYDERPRSSFSEVIDVGVKIFVKLPGSVSVLTLGILNIVFAGLIGLILGIVRITQANRVLDLNDLYPDRFDPNAISQVKAGKVRSYFGFDLSRVILLVLISISHNSLIH